MELQGHDLTNLPLGLSLPRAKLPIFTYQPQEQQRLDPMVSVHQTNSTSYDYHQQGQQSYVLFQAQSFQTLQNVQQTQHVEQYQHQEQEQVLSHDDSGFDLMDDSLTDMQWLQRMDAAGVPGFTKGGRKRAQKRAADKENKKPTTKDSTTCRKKLEYSSSKKSSSSNKPPLSYASLISLAICSTPQRMMTLSGIYRWIENTFPFYRTPEAKAWKNSIRHNLSIRKNMFMKVYQYPPRRGNGSYWTLLPDGEEELKRAVPLFSTFRPPIIDSDCMYSRGASTHTVKSKGQFVPLLPRSTLSSTGGQAYFSVDGMVNSGACVQSQEDEEVTTEVVLDSAHLVSSERVHNISESNCLSENLPLHVLEHSYAKQSQIAIDELLDNSTTDSEKESEACPPTPKRKKKSRKPTSKRQVTTDHVSRPTGSDHKENYDVDLEKGDSHRNDEDDVFQTPPKGDQDISLNLLDGSFLTPLRNLGPDVEIGPISLSPLYTNFVTPKRSSSSTSDSAKSPTASSNTKTATADLPVIHTPSSSSSTTTSSSLYHGSSNSVASNSALPLPLTPLRSFSSSGSSVVGVGNFDSGIFSPLSADTFNVKFSTPTLSPLSDLLQPNTFSTPHAPEFLTPLKVLDSSKGSGNTPLRLGSLEALGLPGFTPPTASLKKSHR